MIRRSFRKAAGEKYRSLQRHGEVTEPKSRECPVMVGLEVLPPRLAAGQQPRSFGFSNSLSLDRGSIINIFNWQIPPAELPTAKTRCKLFLCFKKWPLALERTKF